MLKLLFLVQIAFKFKMDLKEWYSYLGGTLSCTLFSVYVAIRGGAGLSQFVMQTGRVNRQRHRDAKEIERSPTTPNHPHPLTHTHGEEKREVVKLGPYLMRNENKLKSNFRITSSLAFQCKFNQQQGARWITKGRIGWVDGWASWRGQSWDVDGLGKSGVA